MANNVGLFQWIREGVRQSVLLGVTDALESIGSPDDKGSLHPALLSINGSHASSGKTAAIEGEAIARKSAPAQRKRLGRSLKDIEPSKPAT